MVRYNLLEAGLNPEKDVKLIVFAGAAGRCT
jgi:hypothetical protein